MIDPQLAICHPTGPCSSHFSATLVLFLDPTPNPHLVESPWLQAWFTAPAQHSLDTKLPGLLGLHDFYCTTLHHTPNPDGVLHNIWWYRICQQVEIGIIGLCWALWVWSVLTGSVPETKLERLDIIDMHIKPWHFGPPTKLWALLFCSVSKCCNGCRKCGERDHSSLSCPFRILLIDWNQSVKLLWGLKYDDKWSMCLVQRWLIWGEI